MGEGSRILRRYGESVYKAGPGAVLQKGFVGKRKDPGEKGLNIGLHCTAPGCVYLISDNNII